jgi:energy-coupling factor transporter ATP-binding protein EcfA2
MSQITSTESKLKATDLSVQNHEKAREIIRQVGLATQKKLQYHISEVTTLALEAVFPNPYELVVEFVERRNKTECDLLFKRNGKVRDDPMDESGGGTIDVAAFALRVASWSMERPRSNNVLILDEPFSRLKGQAANRQVLEMVRKVSKQTGLQIIMVSDERIPFEDIVDTADKVFKVTMKGEVSQVVES